MALAATLTLDTTTSLSVHQRFDLGHAHPIEIAENRMLEARRRGRKLQCALVVAIRSQPMDDSRRERIARADAVHDVGNLIALAVVERRAGRQHGGPSVAMGAMTLTQRDRLPLEIRKFGQDSLGQ